MTPEERRAQTAAANVAARGRKASLSERSKVASAKEATGRFDSPAERQLASNLRRLGHAPIPQKAIGTYNIDLAVRDVAVEVLGGHWHAYKPTHRERTKAILDQGWHVVFIWNTELHPLALGATGYLVSFLEESGRDPSSVREYRVVRGDGHEIARGDAENYDLTFIPPSRAA